MIKAVEFELELKVITQQFMLRVEAKKGRRPESVNSPRRKSRVLMPKHSQNPEGVSPYTIGATCLPAAVLRARRRIPVCDIDPGFTSGVSPELSRRAIDGKRLRRAVFIT